MYDLKIKYYGKIEKRGIDPYKEKFILRLSVLINLIVIFF